jgi:hypothetical protein
MRSWSAADHYKQIALEADGLCSVPGVDTLNRDDA